jgi:hypothetical protein
LTASLAFKPFAAASHETRTWGTWLATSGTKISAWTPGIGRHAGADGLGAGVEGPALGGVIDSEVPFSAASNPSISSL